MTEICVRRPVDDRSVTLLRDVAAAASTHDGHPALGDGVERDLAARGSASAIVLALDGARAVAAMHLSAPDRAGNVTGTLVLAPEARTGTVGRALVDAACDDVTSRGIARLEYWVLGSSGETDLGAEPPVRELYEMRVALPLARPAAEPTWPEGVRVRAFVVEGDEPSWLEVNNRAFVTDPDQGAWTPATLQVRIEEAWFDPAGFLLAEDDAGLAGSCWTKVHPATPPFDPEPLGEIYVIGVDPDRQGTGLGRALVVGGLAWLHEQGIGVGMLFVDAVNVAAVRLYESLGFETTRVDRAFACGSRGPASGSG